MHDLTVTRETYQFWCRSCGHIWETEYEARRSSEWAGAELVGFYLRGMPVMSPYGGVPCPSCHDLRTVVTPQVHSVRTDAPVQQGAPG